MNLANILTGSRIVMSPVFLIVYFIPVWTGRFGFESVVICWSLFILMELSDLFDGMAARAANQVSDLGKVFDPFADVVSRLTYFLCFTVSGFMPVLVFAIIMYRELGILFIRMLAVKKGFVMGARAGGKLKAWSYAFSGISGLLYVSILRTGFFPEYAGSVLLAAKVFFLLSAVSALASLADYLIMLKKKFYGSNS
ncbi:MAG: CDP-alcohol phosphatidyltransferase family protein [Spirochaetia bacterium]|jgi:CDP-diacylglycerol--glycerol-3-phosphate 3-phosphatidyltransferase|nr:CDP-alcohol phosphatidyltransferase family protein [Spirochaetia bacterium]